MELTVAFFFVYLLLSILFHSFVIYFFDQKSHLAAYESGRKTAEHMLSLYPDYFTQIWEDPLPNVIFSPRNCSIFS